MDQIKIVHVPAIVFDMELFLNEMVQPIQIKNRHPLRGLKTDA